MTSWASWWSHEKAASRARRRRSASRNPALSHSVKALEDRLGVRLLNRTTRKVVPTEAGERIMKRMAPHFVELEDELASIVELRDTPAGPVSHHHDRLCRRDGSLAEAEAASAQKPRYLRRTHHRLCTDRHHRGEDRRRRAAGRAGIRRDDRRQNRTRFPDGRGRRAILF